MESYFQINIMQKKGDSVCTSRDQVHGLVPLTESEPSGSCLVLASFSFYCIPSSLLLRENCLLINKKNLPRCKKHRDLSLKLFSFTERCLVFRYYQMMVHLINSCRVYCDLSYSAQEDGSIFGKQMALVMVLLLCWPNEEASLAFTAFVLFFLL